ncbi:YdcF family protein [Entomohabitans teleogrylli]|uniref:YdcF family protein n=1 Tax=Entomohabitans teleogrylli TaxID=1384589 RepID=UPI00073D1D3D|nr:YdcF family protein [Entomohabitans teleogrylli]
MTTPESTLTAQELAAANTLGDWLAQDDTDGAPAACGADLLIVAGNAVIPVIDAACRLASESQFPVLITGGIGHSTEYLYQAVAAHPRYQSIPCEGRPEAEIIADIAIHYWQLPAGRILCETTSTNCGENACFTRELLLEQGICPRHPLVIQDPTMQRRMMATFARAWRDGPGNPEWLSYPGLVPSLEQRDGVLHFVTGDEGMWSVDRYLSLLLGEIPRLRDDASGYGPDGKDYIAHVDIPDAIEAAWCCLASAPGLAATISHRATV